MRLGSFSLCLFLSISNFSFAVDLAENAHLTKKYAHNGLRYELETYIMSVTSDDNVRAMLRHYSFFADQFVNDATFKQAGDFIQLQKVKLCIGFENEKLLDDILGIVLLSSELRSKFDENNEKMSKEGWVTEAVYVTDCNYEIPNTQAEFEYSIQAAYAEDICKNISEKTAIELDPIAQKRLRECENAKKNLE